jgi:hypothetical protein
MRSGSWRRTILGEHQRIRLERAQRLLLETDLSLPRAGGRGRRVLQR